MRTLLNPRPRRGFTLLEVILSITILTVIVYSLFIVFDRTMQVIDKIFVGAHKYEVLKNFLENLRKELNSSTTDKPGETYRFRGGPHWLEFSLPVITSADDINTYIQQGVNQLTAEYRKVCYLAARPQYLSSLEDTVLYKTPVFRFQSNPTSPLVDPHYSFLVHKDTDGVSLILPPINPRLPVINEWYETVAGRAEIDSWDPDPNTTAGLNRFYDARKALDCRYIQFRYFYTVHYLEGANKMNVEYSQDWWDSGIKYPLSEPAAAADSNFNLFYSDSNYRTSSHVLALEDERLRRYASVSSAFPLSENWLYEKEPLSFRAFARGSGSGFGWSDFGLQGSYSAGNSYCRLEMGDSVSPDPWFAKLPASVEVRVTLFDLAQDSKIAPDPKDLYRGETFVMRIFLQAHSDSVTKYKGNLLNEG